MTLAKEAFYIVLGLIALYILLNPTFGIAEPIPDNAPLIGNIDDALAVIILNGLAIRYLKFNPQKEVNKILKVT